LLKNPEILPTNDIKENNSKTKPSTKNCFDYGEFIYVPGNFDEIWSKIFFRFAFSK